MKRLIMGATLSVAIAFGTLVGTAYAVDEHAPHGGPGSHPHHVHTGNGECEDIDERSFEPAGRGLHRGANESGPEHGPYHGTCASHTH